MIQPTSTNLDWRLARATWLAVGLVLIFAAYQFWTVTMPVRLANTDDVVFQHLADTKTTDAFMAHNALQQGRFYFTTPILGPALTQPYRIHDNRWFSLARAAALFAQVGLAAWLVARVMGQPVFAAAFAVFVVSTLHLPLTFFPILSYPPFWGGFCAVLAALHVHQSHLQRPRAWTGATAGCLYLVACLMNESFVLFLPLFAALGWASSEPHWARAMFAPCVAAFGYLAAYALFARMHPTNYSGTQLSLDVVAASQVVIRQLGGIIPGAELVMRRPTSDGFEPFLRTAPEILQTLVGIPWASLLLAMLEGTLLAVLVRHCVTHPPRFLHGWPAALLFAAVINLPVAFSAKYQVFLLRRTFPYVYAFYSFFFLCLAALSIMVIAGQHPLARRHALVFQVGVGLVCTAMCWSAAASNLQVLRLLTKLYN